VITGVKSRLHLKPLNERNRLEKTGKTDRSWVIAVGDSRCPAHSQLTSDGAVRSARGDRTRGLDGLMDRKNSSACSRGSLSQPSRESGSPGTRTPNPLCFSNQTIPCLRPGSYPDTGLEDWADSRCLLLRGQNRQLERDGSW